MTTPRIPALCQSAIEATEIFQGTPALDPIRTPLSSMMRLMAGHKVVEKSGESWAVHAEVFDALPGEVKAQADALARQAARVLVPETPAAVQAHLNPFQSQVLSVPLLSPQLCRDNPDVLFVFEDNLNRVGTLGQAVIRDEPNAVGIPTRVHQGKERKQLFSDSDLDLARRSMQPDVARLRAHIHDGGRIAWPEEALGTGLAELPTRAPSILAYITQVQSSLDPATPKYYAGIGARDTPPEVLAKMTQVAAMLHQDSWILRSGGADGADNAFEDAIRRPDRTMVPGASEIILGWDGFSSKKDTPPELLKFARQGYLLPNLPDPMVELFQKKMQESGRKPFGPMVEEKLVQATNSWYKMNPKTQARPNLARSILGPGMDDEGQRKLATAALDMVRQYHPAPEKLGKGGVRLQARNGFQILGPKMDAPVDVVVSWTKDGTAGGGTGQALRLARDKGIRVMDLGHPLYAAWTPAQIVAAVQDPRLQPDLPITPPVTTRDMRGSKGRGG